MHLLRTVRGHCAPLELLIGGAGTATVSKGCTTLEALTTAAYQTSSIAPFLRGRRNRYGFGRGGTPVQSLFALPRLRTRNTVVKAFNTALAARQANPVVDGTLTDGFVAGVLEGMALLNITHQIRTQGAWQAGWKLLVAHRPGRWSLTPTAFGAEPSQNLAVFDQLAFEARNNRSGLAATISHQPRQVAGS